VTDGSSVASAADEVIVNVVKELPASSTSFTYDGNGDRVLQTKGGVDTTYVVDSVPDNERVLMETTASATTYYIYGHDMLYSIDTAGPHYQHTDSLGSVVAITGASGAIEQTYDYDVFGVMRAASGTSGNRYTFTGEENDASGLVCERAITIRQRPGSCHVIPKRLQPKILREPTRTLTPRTTRRTKSIPVARAPTGEVSPKALRKPFSVRSR
jgi:hypothetical protein